MGLNQHPITLTLLDKTAEKGSMTVFTGPITASTLAAYLSQWGALKGAIDALTVGTLNRENLVLDNTILSETLPLSNLAQREIKALVTYTGNTSGKKYQVSIPTFDLTKAVFTPGAKDFISLTQPQEVADFVSAFQTLCKTPDDDTEGVTVQSIRAVGVNS